MGASRRSGGTTIRCARVPALKPAYLIHGDDHGRISERRANLRSLGEREGGAIGVEVLSGDEATPEAAAAALNAMTFAMGHRVVIVDAVERFGEADVKKHLVPALGEMPADTTVAFFAREEGRYKAPKALIEAVRAAGGDVREEATMKAKELPKWLQGEASRLGATIDRDAGLALVALVGDRQQRLLREVEKLAIEHGPDAHLTLEHVEAAGAHSAERQVWTLVDALVAGNGPKAIHAFLELRAQGESMPRLVPLMARRVRDVLAIALRLEAGESPGEIKKSIKGSPWAADRRISEARATDADTLRRAIVVLADLELGTRRASELAEDTLGLRAIEAIAGHRS
jgi:DNA polymerase III subunit delta